MDGIGVVLILINYCWATSALVALHAWNRSHWDDSCPVFEQAICYSSTTNHESIYNIPINSFLHLTFTINLKMIRVIRISELGTNLCSVLSSATISSLNKCRILLLSCLNFMKPHPLTSCPAPASIQTQISKFVEKLKRIHQSRLFVHLIFDHITGTPRFRHILRKPCCTKNEYRNLICVLEYNDMHLLYWFKFCFHQRLFPKRTGKPHTHSCPTFQSFSCHYLRFVQFL